MPARDVVIDSLRAALAKRSDVRLALLFGSVARGNAWAESDVDLAVLGDGIDIAQLGEALERAVGARVDVVSLTSDIPVALLTQLLQDGICIYEGSQGAHAAWRSAALWSVETDGPLLARAGRIWLQRVAQRGFS